VVSSHGVNQPLPGEANTVYARVTNLGRQDATGVRVRFWWADPSLAITEVNAHEIGIASADIPAGCSVVVECPVPWVPVVENAGHECLLAEAFIPQFDPLTAPLDPVDDRQVGQKNEQLVLAGPNQAFSAKLHAVNITGILQPMTLEVQALRTRTVPALLARRAAAFGQAKIVPPTMALPLKMNVQEGSDSFAGASAFYARRLLSMTQQEIAGKARYCAVPAQITRTANFEPWQARTVEISGKVPPDARIGQSYAFRVIQRAGLMVTGGYTVHVLVVER
jgi:hypothetical protein